MRATTWAVLIVFVVAGFAMAQPEWETVVISTGYTDASAVGSGDVNGDGDMDIVAGARGNGNVGWFEYNNDTGDWIEHTVATLSATFCVGVADINNDGANDILAGSLDNDMLYWYEQDGDTWVPHLVDGSADGVSQIRVHDFNGDGLPDIAANLYYASQVVVYFQQAGGSWQQTVLVSNYQYCNDMDIADMDDDGDMDVISCTYSSDKIAWFANDGGTFGPEQIITTSVDGPWAIDIIDVNADGMQDVVCGAYGEGTVTWYDQANGWSSTTMVSGLGSPRDVEAGDLDMDGDIDLYVAANSSLEVRCYERDDDNWIMHTLGTSVDCWRLHATDLGDDNDPDLAFTAYNNGSVSVSTLLGSPIPPPVDIDLIPQMTTIPPNGGAVLFGADLINNTQNVQYGQAWSMVQLPNGQEFGPLVLVPITMPVGTISVFNLSQAIPGLAPAGSYTFTGLIGLYNPGIVAAQDQFTFVKLGTEPSSITEWTASDWVFPTSTTEVAGEADDPYRPVDFALAPVYPNPFNASATVTVTLPRHAELTVELVNTAGQRVAELVHGTYPSGRHEFHLDGSSLASGMYLVRAHVPGELSAVQKVMLVR